jgi:hypothetical protein
MGKGHATVFILNESRRYNQIALISQASFRWSFVPTHTLAPHLHEEDPLWLDGQMKASSINSNRIPHTILNLVFHQFSLQSFLTSSLRNLSLYRRRRDG